MVQTLFFLQSSNYTYKSYITCWLLLTEYISELTQNLNIVTQTLTLILSLWPINSDVLTSLLLPHISSSLTDSLPSLNLLCCSKTDARFRKNAPKEVRSIPYVSVAFFSKFKTEFYCISFF